MKLGLGVALISTAAAAAPRPVTIKVKDAPLYDVARMLGEQTGCRIAGFATAERVSLDVTNGTLWDVLAKLEVDYGILTQFRGGQLFLDKRGASTRYWGLEPNPTWSRHWRGGSSGWAVALLGDVVDTRARLVVLGVEGGAVDKLVIDKASAGARLVKTAPLPVPFGACEPAAIPLELDAAAAKLTLRGHLVIKLPKLLERRVTVPLDDSVVDVAEGRLRLHVASKLERGARVVHVGWDGMGDPANVSVALVDDTDTPVPTSGRGSTSSNTMGSSDFTVAASLTKLVVVVRLPGTATSEEKVRFRFDGEPLDRPARP